MRRQPFDASNCELLGFDFEYCSTAQFIHLTLAADFVVAHGAQTIVGRQVGRCVCIEFVVVQNETKASSNENLPVKVSLMNGNIGSVP